MKKLKKYFFHKTFFPSHDENRMENEGDLKAARSEFFKNRFNNLDFLLEKRYLWMNKYINKGMNIIEVGAGAGFSTLYLENKPTLTDAVNNPWVDQYVDATNMPFKDSSIDIIIASHTIHHFYNPAKFFFECTRVLKKGGKILISEIHTSFFMRLMLYVMKHEGYSYGVNVFDTKSICNDKRDLWSANCAIPEILFYDKNFFNDYFSDLNIELVKYCEFFIFPLSGGVTAKIRVPRLPLFIIKIFHLIDKILVQISPKIFALGMKAVISKK